MAARARVVDDDYDLVSPKPRSDVYTGMLVIALLATLTGLLFLFMDYKEYPSDKKPNPKAQVSMPEPAAPAK